MNLRREREAAVLTLKVKIIKTAKLDRETVPEIENAEEVVAEVGRNGAEVGIELGRGAEIEKDLGADIATDPGLGVGGIDLGLMGGIEIDLGPKKGIDLGLKRGVEIVPDLRIEEGGLNLEIGKRVTGFMGRGRARGERGALKWRWLMILSLERFAIPIIFYVTCLAILLLINFQFVKNVTTFY